MLMCNRLGALFCAYAIQFQLSWPIIMTCFVSYFRLLLCLKFKRGPCNFLKQTLSPLINCFSILERGSSQAYANNSWKWMICTYLSSYLEQFVVYTR